MKKFSTIIIVALIVVLFGSILACSTPPAKNNGNEQTGISFYVDGNEIAVEQAENGIVKLPTTPQKDGYRFEGWYNDDNIEDATHNLNRQYENQDGTFAYLSSEQEKTASYYAIFTRVYKYIFNTNGGKIKDSDYVLDDGKYYLLLANDENEYFPIPSKYGYNFLGWKENDKYVYEYGNGDQLLDNKGADRTFEAEWKACSSKLIVSQYLAYNENYKNTTNSSYYVGSRIEKLTNEDVQLKVEDIAEYNFVCWYKKPSEYTTLQDVMNNFDLNNVISIQKECTVKMEMNMEVIAIWHPYRFATSGDTNAGTFTKYNPTIMTEGSQVSLYAYPKHGYTFKGWYDGSELVSKELEFVYEMKLKSVDLKAEFYAINTQFKVTKIYAEDSIYTSNATFNGDIIKPSEYLHLDGNEYEFTAVDVSGFLFDGWYKDGELITNKNSITIVASNASQVIEAKFYMNKTTFSANIPTATNLTVPTITYKGQSVTASVEVLPGHKFVGWYDVVDGDEKFITNEENLTVVVDVQEHNYVAKFTENTLTLLQNNDQAGEISKGYKVDFINTLNGKVLYETQYVSSKNPLIMPQIPLSGDRVFRGWYLDEAYLKPFDWSAVINKDLTLYSMWDTYNSDSLRTTSYTKMGEWDLTYIDDTSPSSKRYYYYGATHNQTVDIELAGYRTSRSGSHWHIYTYVRIVNETTHGIEFEKLLQGCPNDPIVVKLKLNAGAKLRIEFYYAGGEDGIGRDPISATSEIFKIRITDKTPAKATSDLNCVSGHYHTGEKIMLSASVFEGYTFDGWYIGEERISFQLSYEYTMIDDNVTIEARFI